MVLPTFYLLGYYLIGPKKLMSKDVKGILNFGGILRGGVENIQIFKEGRQKASISLGQAGISQFYIFSSLWSTYGLKTVATRDWTMLASCCSFLFIID